MQLGVDIQLFFMNGNNFIRKYFEFNSEELFTSKYKKDQKIPEKLNMNTTELLESVDIMLNYADEVNPNKNLDAPNVPTSIIYGSFLDTKTAYLYNETQNLGIFPANQIFFHGGDGTVTTYGSLLPALKWIYDKNEINKTCKIIINEFLKVVGRNGTLAFPTFTYSFANKKRYYYGYKS